MSADPFFRMTVEDVFFIRGRGTVVMGRIENGILMVNDEIYLRHSGSSRKVAITGLEISRKMIDQAKAGDTVGILFRDLTKPEVEKGDVLLGSDI